MAKSSLTGKETPLAALMVRHGLAQNALANMIGANRQTVARWVKGEVRIDASHAARIAAATGWDAADILVGAAPQPEIREVPLVSWVAAGPWAEAQSVMRHDITKTITAIDLPPGDWIALEVVGDSMDRISPDGSIIFVNRKERDLRDKQLYVALDEEGNATYKRYRNTGGPERLEPVSSNHNHQPIFPDKTIRVIGRVRRTTYEIG